MGFLAVCSALYDYQPQGSGELEIHEGELLFILEKSAEDDWWKAKKKADGDDEDEPEGLIPNNYVEDAIPKGKAKALYDYSRQTDEEVSFSEDEVLDVYDTSDSDWTLVAVNGDYGFAPANYIEMIAGGGASLPSAPVTRQIATPVDTEPEEPDDQYAPASPVSPARPMSGPAANLAKVLGGGTSSTTSNARAMPPAPQQLTPENSDEEEEVAPVLPRRPQSQSSPLAVSGQFAQSEEQEPAGVVASPPYIRTTSQPDDGPRVTRHGGFHLYNVSEMVSAMGRRRKMPTTLGINIATGTVMLHPEKTKDGPSQEWTAEKMTHYSIEGKHVFLELVRPSKSLDIHAGARDTAEEIVAALSEIAGASRAEGIREVIAAASGSSTQKKGVVLYDFMAQGDDEVTVAAGDEVVILDDEKSEEWWNVRRLKNGMEGVMPSSYVEVTGTISVEPASRSGINAGLSNVEQNRLEEERLALEAARSGRVQEKAERSRSKSEVGPGMQLPQRGSSLGEEDARKGKKDRRSSRADGKSRSKPDPSKTRTWTDHSGTFKVDAQFIGIADGKIHLHKVNGIKIAVPVTKMSAADLEYVEKVTNEPIDDHIPVADLIKMKRRSQSGEASGSRSGASLDPTTGAKPPEYDWFEFFLTAGVGPHQCERYSQAMIRDSMDETVLPDITQDTLRTLGLKEGDAIKVMKYLDQKFNRNRSAVNGESSGGLFSGPGGVLHNNTGRTRPEAKRQASDVVDASAFEPKATSKPSFESKETTSAKAPAREERDGFEDDAWTVQPSKQSATGPSSASMAPPPPKPPTGALADLSLLDKPLEPTPAAPPKPVDPPATQIPLQASSQVQIQSAPPQQAQQTGANPSFFAQLNPQSTGFQQNPTINVPRQRPQPPPQNYSGLISPPPRPTSAPQNAQQNQFGVQPLQPQLTGIPSNSALQAPPGHSLDELNRQRLQNQYNQFQLQAQQTGFPQQGFSQFSGIVPQQTGFPSQQQFGQIQQPYINGNAAGSPFADPRPGAQSQFQGLNTYNQSPPPGGINSVLPLALQPQKTGFIPLQQHVNGVNQGFQPQPTGFQQSPLQPQQTAFQQPLQPQQTAYQQLPPQPTGFQPQANGFGNFQPQPPPQLPPMPQPQSLAPLQPQKTGPAPPVKFGVTEAKKLTPQPTGRRANLAQATPQNPFGF